MTHYLPIKEYVMSTDSSSVSTETKNTEIRVYWQPGCTSCLRTKEFLSSHGIPFVSRNVLADENAFAELSRFGLRQVPIVTLGDKWANGQVLADVARLVGITDLNARMLPVDERSEEHTSELQSPMRNSYDVFCLKKQK